MSVVAQFGALSGSKVKEVDLSDLYDDVPQLYVRKLSEEGYQAWAAAKGDNAARVLAAHTLCRKSGVLLLTDQEVQGGIEELRTLAASEGDPDAKERLLDNAATLEQAVEDHGPAVGWCACQPMEIINRIAGEALDHNGFIKPKEPTGKSQAVEESESSTNTSSTSTE